MNGFYYTDIFSTKGIEYLLIISFFLTYIPFYRQKIIDAHHDAALCLQIGPGVR